MAANAIEVKDVTKVYRLYDKPIDRLKESLSLTHKTYHKDFYALNSLSSLYYTQGAALVQTDLDKAKAEFAEAKKYLEKLIPLLSDANATQKKIKANANTMLNYINSLK